MIEVLKTGLYTTIQDQGRFDYQTFGVPISGYMDQYSAGLANLLVGNDENAALLEITMTGPKLRFLCNSCICITGADISPMINEDSIELNKAIFIRNGDVISFGKLNVGFRAYLAVAGGIRSDTIMGSRSQYQHITKEPIIQKGNYLSITPQTQMQKAISTASIRVARQHFASKELSAFEGPELHTLNQKQRDQLFENEFTISTKNSRMAYQLNETIPNDLKSIITSLVLPGTVQLTPSGQLIILMRDCQTTGGYPRILQLSHTAINRLSQKKMNEKLKFRIDASFFT